MEFYNDIIFEVHEGSKSFCVMIGSGAHQSVQKVYWSCNDRDSSWARHPKKHRIYSVFSFALSLFLNALTIYNLWCIVFSERNSKPGVLQCPFATLP